MGKKINGKNKISKSSFLPSSARRSPRQLCEPRKWKLGGKKCPGNGCHPGVSMSAETEPSGMELLRAGPAHGPSAFCPAPQWVQGGPSPSPRADRHTDRWTGGALGLLPSSSPEQNCPGSLPVGAPWRGQAHTGMLRAPQSPCLRGLPGPGAHACER